MTTNRLSTASLRRVLIALAWLLAAHAPAGAQTVYFPGPGEAWERRTPAQAGLDPAGVQAAIAFAIESESRAPRNLLENHMRSFGREPHGEATGPFKDRGDPAGIIVRGGYIVAEWGDPHRVDVTFSVTKSFVSAVVGVAHDRGMIRSVHDPVGSYMAPVVALVGPPGGGAPLVEVPRATPRAGDGTAYDAFEVLDLFASDHARRITWDHLLRQTSDWAGTLWGKPDWADRPRGDLEAWRVRERHEPGAVHTYNDVRVNLLALAALNVWRRPLPQVLKEHVMDPIGASNSWRWYGYDNSWIVLDGQLVQSVSGGAHWGGGMFINARDMARFGYLTLRRGRWNDRQVLSEEWIRMATTPTDVQPNYGFMNFFLNTGRGQFPSAPEQAFFHLGAGNNVVYVDPVNDLVIVMRWISSLGAADGVVQRVLAAIR
jgi:CubicO group peptidase (beta-lactamase class C family)